MLTLDDLKKINNPKTDLDEYMEIIGNTDYIDDYLLRLIDRFKKIEFDKYYLSYSGGKDSHFLYWFIKEVLQDDKIKIVGINTYMEHHEILQRILKNSDIVLRPKLKPFEIKEKYGIPCFSKWQDDMIDRYQRGSRQPYLLNRITGINQETGEKIGGRFRLSKTAREGVLNGTLHKISPMCCKYLKKEPAKQFERETGLKPILGVRSSESALRSVQYRTCFTKSGKFTPLHDLTNELLEKIIERYNIEVPKVYKYIERTGCMGCPYGSHKHDTEKELGLIFDNQRKFVYEYFKESYEVLNIDLSIQTTIYDFIEE